MDIQKPLLISTLISTTALVVTPAFSPAVWAVGIGGAVLQSRQGEPLYARVDLTVERGEQIDNSCLSLAAPDPLQQDAGLYLTEADLSLKTDGKRQYVDIRSHLPLNNALTRLRLQIKCPGVLGILKTITLPLQQTASNNEPRSIPNSSGTITAEEFALLLDQQKQIASSFAGMQQKIRLLEDELRDIKLQLAQTGVNSSNAAAPVPPAIAGAQENSSSPGSAINQWSTQQYFLEVIEVIMLVILVSWLGLRYYTRMKLTARTGLRQHASEAQASGSNTVSNAVAPSMANASPAIRQPSQASGSQLPAAAQPPLAGAAGDAAIPHSGPSPVKFEKEMANDVSMLEEASLYAANGRMEKAVEILKEIIGRNPSKEDAWKLLLSVYSALGKAAEFEKTARSFLKYHKASPSWNGIQVLGRTLDRDNPLYVSQNEHISSSPLLPDSLSRHRPIGDVLIETGALSKQEVLKYLDEFDPRQHGRFGGFLVARKAITLAELDQALLQQQGGSHVEAKPGNLPSLQEIEKLLDEFDPKQHGSVIKFLASRNIALPEQLSQFLLQQKKLQAIDTPPSGNLSLP
ncbi:MAG: hypothetical protein HY846_05850 [Nitrosomonadales bacterium]|nr:hypothetical protein [Nitrosomonadales bacterium]